MYLSSYEFHGETDDLVQAYDRLMTTFPVEEILFHACVRVSGGIVVIDACPTEAVFAEFSTSPEFTAAIRSAGLPAPVITPLGDVHAARSTGGALVQ